MPVKNPLEAIADTPQCYMRHLGVWAIRVPWFEQAVSLAIAGTLPIQAAAQEPPGDDNGALVTRDGVLIVNMHGAMTKPGSKFGGTSTLQTRRMLRAARTDETIQAAMLHIDSPGGHVDGVDELDQEVQAFAAAKPIHGFIDDLGASAAIWASAHVDRLSINRAGEAGSIGAYALLLDATGAMEREGLRVVRVASGPFKGAGAVGTPITEELEAEVQRTVDRVAGRFVDAVADGRRIGRSRLNEMADGRMFGAEEAVEAKLVDSIETFDQAMARLTRQATARTKTRALRSTVAEAKLCSLKTKLKHG